MPKSKPLSPRETDLVIRALYTHRDELLALTKRHPKWSALGREVREELKAAWALCRKLEAK